MDNPMKRKSTNNLNHESDRVNPSASGRELILARCERDSEIERTAAAYRRDLGHSPKKALSVAIADDGVDVDGSTPYVDPYVLDAVVAPIERVISGQFDALFSRLRTEISAKPSSSFPHSSEFANLVAQGVLGLLRNEIADLVDSSKVEGDERIFCAICSHDDCKHFHALTDYSVPDIVEYLAVEKSTIYTWLYKERITRPVSESPHLWDPHVIGCFKHDRKLVFPSPIYDRTQHLRLLREARATTAAKKAATHAKRSAHAMRLNARRKTTRKAQHPKKISKATKRGAK
jgi:hypothetical protein